jgi:hypothetical protein
MAFWGNTSSSPQNSAFCLLHADVLLDMLYNSEDGGDKPFQNGSWL